MMPTAPLPLFQALLNQLDIPLSPPSIPSIPPSLLLLTLERILGTRIPLPASTRKCGTQADELALVKCLMGIMGDDELGMDLTAVDPARVIRGSREEMGVMIMALVVIAKRRGMDVTPVPREGNESFGSVRSGDGASATKSTTRSTTSGLGGDETQWSQGRYGSDRWYGLDIIDAMDGDGDDDDDAAALGRPLEPDVTLSSPILPSASTSTFASRDVFGDEARTDDLRAPNKARSGLFRDGRLSGYGTGQAELVYGEEGNWTVDRYDPDGGYETPMPRNGFNVPLVQSGPGVGMDSRYRRGTYVQLDTGGRTQQEGDGARRDDEKPYGHAQGARKVRDALAFEKVASWREDSQTTATTSTLVTGASGHRTVLQEMMDEFGLG